MEYMDALERRTHDEFAEWHVDLSEAQQDDIAAAGLLLMEQGPRLPFPYSSGINGSRHPHMRELRVQSGGRPAQDILCLRSEAFGDLCSSAGTRQVTIASTSAWSRSPTHFMTFTSTRSERKD
jgi:hypothetical protein